MDVYGPQLVGRGGKGKLGKRTVKVLLQGTFTFVLIIDYATVDRTHICSETVPYSGW